MPLIADYTRIDNFKEVVYLTREEGGFDLNPVTQALVFASMLIGQGELTKENLQTWYERIRILEIIDGNMMPSGRLMRDHLHSHVGLRVNVSLMSDDEFKEMIFESLVDRVYSMDLQ